MRSRKFRINCWILIIIILSGFSAIIRPQGVTGGALLKISPGNFIGGNEFLSSTGYGSPIHSINYPSVMAKIDNLSFATHYKKIGWDVNYINGIVVYPVNNKLSMGLAFQALVSPSIDRRILNAQGVYEKDGSIDVGSFSLPLLICYQFSPNIISGIKLQYYNETLYTYSANAFMGGVDLRIIDLFEGTTSLGLSINHQGNRLEFYRESSPLPLLYSGEITFLPLTVPVGLVVQANKIWEEDITLAVGLEYQYDDMVFIHGGYAMQTTESLGMLAGFGFKSKGFSFIYDFEPMEYFGDLHKFSLIYSLPLRESSYHGVKPFSPEDVSKVQKSGEQKESTILPPPDGLKSSLFNGELHLEWNYDIFKYQNVYFEVYAALDEKGKWLKISKGKLTMRTMSFHPTAKNISFYFKIKAIQGNKTSTFSKVLKVNVD